MTSGSILDHTPTFTGQAAARIALDTWRIDGRATALPGERDQNFLLTSADGARYVLKIANALDERPLHDATIAAMERVVEQTGAGAVAMRAVDGRAIVNVMDDAGRTSLARLVTWIDGTPVARISTRSWPLLHDIGNRIGAMHVALAGFDDAALHRRIDWDMASAGAVVRRLGDRIADPDLRSLVQRVAALYEKSVGPLLPSLRTGVIHGDVNDHNILVSDPDRRTGDRVVTGIIDFGDMHHGHVVADLAIAIAYLMLDSAHPLRTASTVIAGFHAERPLTTDEIDVLFPMALMRLAVSVCMAAKQQAERPDDEYLGISQAQIRRSLPGLAAIQPALAAAHFRAACRLDPLPAGTRVRQWIDENCVAFSDVLDEPVSARNSVVFDLDVASPLVSGDPALNAEPILTPRLAARLREAGAQYGIARFDVARLLNTAEAYAGADGGESRTVHLGVDLYAGEGAVVRAPLAGTIVAFKDNAQPQDYGPVVILEHRTEDGDVFHTLWGHLSRASLVGLFEGRELMRGERIGTIGSPHENGGWTPHVHVQIIVDMLGMGTAFPGICRASERDVWTSFSPDPRALLRIPPELFPDRPIPYNRTLEARQTHLAPALSLAYRNPVKIVRGWMQYMFDQTGRRYIDAYNNVPHVGHCHPRVVAAGQRQMATLNTNSRYLHDAANSFAERLAATLPDPLSVVCLVNSASEANELALRMARAHTACTDTIVLEHAYHGNTNTLIDISPYKHDGPGGTGAPDWVHTATMPDAYRGEFRTRDREAGELYAADVRRLIERIQAGDASLAAFIAESCPSVGGQIMFPPGYLEAAYRHVRDAGGVCIADDVQTGYGRIGTHFYAFESQGVVPDIVVLGKPIGNGHPIGAVITTPEIAASFDNGMEFFSTFGGNTVSCAIGLTVLEVVEEEGLQRHALEVGRLLFQRLLVLAERHPIIGDVRGSGLFLGVELVRDRETLEPAGDEASLICDRMRDRGILIGTDGPHHNVLKIRPPMCFTAEDAETLVAALEDVLSMD